MNDLLPMLLAAGWDDILKFLVPLVFLLIWVISQIAEAKKQEGEPRGPRPEGRPRRPNPPDPQQAQQPARAGGEPLRDEVEEFLRRAGRGQKPRQAAEPPHPARAAAMEEIEVLLGDDAPGVPRDRVAETPRPPAAPIEPSRPSAERPRKPRPQKRAPLAPREPLTGTASGPQSLGGHSSQLGARIIQEDADFDVRLKARFEHRLGTLGGRSSSSAPPEETPAVPSPAAQIAGMLSNPEGVRQAIILNEILRRPSDGW